MVEDRWVYAARRLQALNPLSNRVTSIAIVPGACPGEAKMCLLDLDSLEVSKCLHLQNG